MKFGYLFVVLWSSCALWSGCGAGAVSGSSHKEGGGAAGNSGLGGSANTVLPGTGGGESGAIGSGGAENTAGGTVGTMNGGSDATGGAVSGGTGASSSNGGSGGGAGMVTLPDPSLVATVAILGDGGFTMASCNGGVTWTPQHDFTSDRSDHGEWASAGGMAFVNNRIVGALGWGAPGHLISSANGIDWIDAPNSAFGGRSRPNGFGGVVELQGELRAFSSIPWRSTDGLNWMAQINTFPAGVQQFRQGRGFPEENTIVASVENQNSSSRPLGYFLLTSTDRGKTWKEGTGFNSICASNGHSGDIAMAGSNVVVAGDRVCVSNDRGATWTLSNFQSRVSHLFNDRTRLYLLDFSGNLHQSQDGMQWQRLGTASKRGRSALGTFVEGKGFVVVDRDARGFYHSPDGVQWTQASVSVVGTQFLRDVRSGYLSAESACKPAAQ